MLLQPLSFTSGRRTLETPKLDDQWISLLSEELIDKVAEVSTSEEFLKRWRTSMLKTKAFFEEAGIEYVEAFVEEV